MATRCLLIPTSSGIDPTHRYEAAIRLGRSLQAHLNVQFVTPDPASYFGALPEVAIAAGVSQAQIIEEIHGYAKLSRSGLEAWCRDRGITLGAGPERLDAIFATWNHTVGDLQTQVALAGRVNDIIIIDPPDLFEPVTGHIFDAAVFSTGRPALMVPKTELPRDLLRHVCIAWNGSLEAARCVGQAISLLHEAQRLTIIEVETPRLTSMEGADLAGYLRYHGIVAHRSRITTAGESVSRRILAVAADNEATMLLMGAYTHSRIREFLLGGVTQHMVRHATIPVLLTH